MPTKTNFDKQNVLFLTVDNDITAFSSFPQKSTENNLPILILSEWI